MEIVGGSPETLEEWRGEEAGDLEVQFGREVGKCRGGGARVGGGDAAARGHCLWEKTAEDMKR